MHSNDQICALLWLGIEDYAGLWEAIGVMKSLASTEPESEIRRAVECILRQLATTGAVMLFRGREGGKELTPIPISEVAAILAKDGNWIGPRPDGSCIRYGTSPFGESIYERTS